MNSNFKKSQILILSVVAALLSVAPLLSPSLRPAYIYFVLNLLIISLGAEAGLGSVFSRPSYVAAKPVTIQEGTKDDTKQVASTASNEMKGNNYRVVEKSQSEKKMSIRVKKVKKCPSTPSLFFIGNGEGTEPEEVNEVELELEVEEEDIGGLSGAELCAKAENFIGNFYNQLKMQREESWKKIHGFYQKAF